ncbi:unnamed protein product, partial [Bubo scandiacus]
MNNFYLSLSLEFIKLFEHCLTSWVSSLGPELEPSLVVEVEAPNRFWKQRSL